MDLLTDVCPSSREVVKLIPEAKVDNVLSFFEDIINYKFNLEEKEEYPNLYPGPINPPPINISDEEYELSKLDCRNGGKYPFVITPIGAQVLVRLFIGGFIEQKKKSSSKDISSLIEYSNSLGHLLHLSNKRREEEKAQQKKTTDREERISYLIDHPEEALESELNRSFLNRYSYLLGPGDKSFKFAGADVSKVVCSYKSNSGKSKKPYVFITWKLPDGSVHGDVDREVVLNRRNDPERNFGLGKG